MRERFGDLFCAFGRLYLIAIAVTLSLFVLSAVTYPFVADPTTRTIVRFNLLLSTIALGLFGYSYWRCRDYYRDQQRGS